MRRLLTLILLASASGAAAGGFTEPTLVLYGRVLQPAGGTPHLLRTGEMTITLRNTGDAANLITLTTQLRQVGTGAAPEFSYAVPVPMKYDVPAYEKSAFIEVKGAGAQMNVVAVTVNGLPAALASLDDEILSVTQDQRADERRVDIFAGGSTEDADEDGIPAWWEGLYGYNDNLPSDAAGDTDGDGLINLQEFQLGTDPGVANTTPVPLTRSLTVTREGIAGVALRIIDTDTLPQNLTLRVTALPGAVLLRKNAQALAVNGTFTAAEMASGIITLQHPGTGVAGALGLTVSDGVHAAVPFSVDVGIFEPSSAADVQALLWLDAKSISLANGQAVAAWTDRSGRLGTNGQPRSLVQGETARQPSFSNTAGLQAVSFAGAGQHLLASDASLAGTTRALFVYQQAAANNSGVQTVIQSNNLDLSLSPFDGPVGYPGAATFAVGSSAVRGFRTPLQVAALHAWRLSDDQGYAISQGMFDGSLAAAAASRPTVVPSVGARVRLNPAQPSQRLIETPFSGKIHEVLSYDRVLTGRFAGQVECYLLSRWQRTVIWDYADSLVPMTLSGGTTAGVLIGGYGDDVLNSGTGGGILSAGPGRNALRGGTSADIFRYREMDSGTDIIRDFDPAADRLDLSGRFPGKKGNAADFIKLEPLVDVDAGTVVLTTRVMLFFNGSGTVPDQVLTLEGLALGQTDLGRLMGEGVIVAGDLVPDEVMSLSPLAFEVKEAEGRTLEVLVRRQGNTSHAEEVPLNFSGAAVLRRDFSLTNTAGTPARPTVLFPRDAAQASFHVVPAVDALDESDESLLVSVVPRERHYRLGSSTAALTLLRGTGISVSSSANIVAGQGGTGLLMLNRSGDTSGSVEVLLTVSGDAVAGTDYQALPARILIPDGVSGLEVPVRGLPTAGPGVRHLKVSVAQSPLSYTVLSPWSAEFLIVPGNAAAAGGFASWRLVNDPASGSVPLAVYAANDRNSDGISNFEEYLGAIRDFSLIEGNPRDTFEIVMPADVPDLLLGIERSENLTAWQPVSGLAAAGVFLNPQRGFIRTYERERLVPTPQREFFRLSRTYRDPLTGITGTPGLFTGAPVALAFAGAAPWRLSGTSDGGVVVTGLAGGQTSLLAASVNGTATVGFEWLLSGGAGDRLVLKIDGVESASLNPGGSWIAASVPVPAGEHRITWEYLKAPGNPAAAGFASVRKISLSQP